MLCNVIKHNYVNYINIKRQLVQQWVFRYVRAVFQCTEWTGVTLIKVLLQHSSYHTSTNLRIRSDLLFGVSGWETEWQLSLWMRWREHNEEEQEVISCDRRAWKSLSVLWLPAPLAIHIDGTVWAACCDSDGCFISRSWP